MRFGRTLGEHRWPDTPEFVKTAQRLQANAATIMLNAVWSGYDRLLAEVLYAYHPGAVTEEIERSITQYLTPRIRRALPDFCPFDVEQGWHEVATRLPAPAQPPLYDIAFVLRENERVAWPLEAKVLKTDRTISGYIADVKQQFLTGRYAPFSSGGAMLGYLLHGDPGIVLNQIAAKLGCTLVVQDEHRDRPHRVSSHLRVSLHSGTSELFQCHHMIMSISPPPSRAVADLS